MKRHLKDEAIKLRTQQHLTITNIAAELGISVNTAQRWLKDYPVACTTLKRANGKSNHNIIAKNKEWIEQQIRKTTTYAEMSKTLGVPGNVIGYWVRTLGYNTRPSIYECDHCDATFPNHRQLNGHRRIHVNQGSYNKCRRRFDPTFCNHCGNENKDYTRKYCSNRCQVEWEYHNIHVPKLLTGAIKKTNQPFVIRFLSERDGRSCKACGTATWMGQNIPLDIDHIDGDPTNNNAQNLQFLCPNCHRLTDTWGMKQGRRKLKEDGVHGRRELEKRAINSAVECHPDLMEALGSNPRSLTKNVSDPENNRE